jgi:hypothetical protein
MNENSRFDSGFENRKAVLGASHVERSWENADDFNRPMQALVTEYCWGEIWGDTTLPFKTRSLLNLGMLTAMSQHHELSVHVRGAQWRHEGRDSLSVHAGGGVLRRAVRSRRVPCGERSHQGVRRGSGPALTLWRSGRFARASVTSRYRERHCTGLR